MHSHLLPRYWSEDTANQFKFPLFIAIDGDHQLTQQLALAMHMAVGLQVIKNLRVPNLQCTSENVGYCHLSMHYKMLLQLFFECLGAPRMIFLEDDLAIAPDFFNFFEATAPVLRQDATLWCVSAWSDHGQRGRAMNTTALYRTDVLPGLGWMLQADVGLELLPIWPVAGWDDWMRASHTRKGRQCLFPEISRTHTFGAVGTSNGQYYEEHLKPMILNDEKTEWLKMVSLHA